MRSLSLSCSHPRQLVRQRAFTLVEVLIGMSLLGVMMVLLFGSLRICVQNWDIGESKIAAVSQKAVIRNFFVTHLQNLLPLQNDFGEVKQFSFQGDKHKLQFVSSMPASAGRLGIQLFTVFADSRSREGKNLQVSMQPFFPVDDNQGWKTENVVILKDVKAITFDYFGLDETQPAQPAAWYESWLEKNKTPMLVRIVVEMQNGDVWPEIIVELKVDTSTSVPPNPFGIVNGRFTN